MSSRSAHRRGGAWFRFLFGSWTLAVLLAGQLGGGVGVGARGGGDPLATAPALLPPSLLSPPGKKVKY